MGSKLKFSIAFHLQTDGQTEKINQVLEDMLRACALDFKGSWSKYLPLAEFTYNNSYQATIRMAPYEALYGRRCQLLITWHEADEKKILDLELYGKTQLIKDTIEAIKTIRQCIEIAQSRQKSYTYSRCRPLEFVVSDSVFIRVTPMKCIMQFGMKGKLSPLYVRPYEITRQVGKVAYELQLIAEMSAIHNVFHLSILKKYISNPYHMLTPQTVQIQVDLSYKEKPVEILDRTMNKFRNKKIPLVKVLWRNHGYKRLLGSPKMI